MQGCDQLLLIDLELIDAKLRVPLAERVRRILLHLHGQPRGDVDEGKGHRSRVAFLVAA
jgi:hypothetical protein